MSHNHVHIKRLGGALLWGQNIRIVLKVGTHIILGAKAQYR